MKNSFLVISLIGLIACNSATNRADKEYNDSIDAVRQAQEAIKNASPVEKPSADKNAYVLNTANSNECSNYLNGKNFYGRNARLEFHNDGNAYAYGNTNNEIVFAGYVESGERKGTNSRYIKVHDSMGGSQFLNLLLSDDGRIMDISDFSMWEPK